MRERPQVLFLSQCLPEPPHSGVRARTFNILKQLHAEFDVTLLAFSRRGHQRDAAARRASERVLATIVHHVDPSLPIPGERSRARRLWDHARSLITARPYTFYEYDSAAFESQLRRLIRGETFALIHLDSLDLYRWLGDLPSVPITCTHHSIESNLLHRQARLVKSRLLRRYLDLQGRLIERVERVLCPSFSMNLMMSADDARALRTLAPASRTIVVPNGVDTGYFTPPPESSVVPGRVVFVGAMDTFPNRDAVEYLLEHIWPLIRSRVPTATLHLIGRGSDTRVSQARSAAVTGWGQVPDIRPFVGSAACVVVPLRAGGGTRLKILDAWSMGKAVVSTAVGSEGLSVADGENVLIRNDANSFAQAVVDVLQNDSLRARLGSTARITTERTYSWDVVGRTLRASYRQILLPSPGVLAAEAPV